jgi:hypothetical protein
VSHKFPVRLAGLNGVKESRHHFNPVRIPDQDNGICNISWKQPQMKNAAIPIQYQFRGFKEHITKKQQYLPRPESKIVYFYTIIC